MPAYRVVETDNLGRDYPDEKFVNIPLCYTEKQAQDIADAINKAFCAGDCDFRFWKVVPADYKLQPGFEP